MRTKIVRLASMLMLATTLMGAASQSLNAVNAVETMSWKLGTVQQSGPNDPMEFEAFLDAYLAEEMETHHIPGVVFTMVKNGEVFFSKGYGYANLETQTPFDAQKTVLTTASLAKAFTAVGILQLYERGVIDLKEDVRPYFKEFQLNTKFDKSLTFANLLTHTDGFEARLIGVAAFSEDDLLPLDQLLATNMPIQIYPPGQYLTYGDYAANLTGYLTQEISGVPYAQYMAENILTPLGMVDSTFDLRLPEMVRDRLATGYEYQAGHQEPMPYIMPRYAPSGGLRTTAADMNRFMLALLNGGEYQGRRILAEPTVKLLFTRQFTAHPKLAGISYGLFEHLENGQQGFLRDGDGVGTRSRMVLFPDLATGFFISYNSGDSNLRLEIISAFLDHYYPAAGANDPEPLADYRERAPQFAGDYRILQADTHTFAKSMFFFAQQIGVRLSAQGYLMFEPTGGGDSFGGFEGASQWVEVEPLYFERLDGKGQLVFSQNEQGQITHLASEQGYHGTFAKLRWYESRNFQIGLIAVTAFFLGSMVIATFIVWPLSALIRRERKQAMPVSASWAARAAWLWGGSVSALLVLSLLQAIGVLYAVGAIAGIPNFAWGVSAEMVNALNLVYAPTILAVAMPIFALLAWRHSWWQVLARVYYTLVTLALMVGIWWAHYWNLIGFRM